MTEDSQYKVKNADGKTMKAGGVIVRKDKNSIFILLLHRYGLNDWVFPKGHVEENEEFYQTAIREIEEEVGLKVSNGKELPDIEYANKENPNGVVVKMYLFENNQIELNAIEEEGDPHWIPIEEVEEKLSYQDLKYFFKSIKKYLQEV